MKSHTTVGLSSAAKALSTPELCQLIDRLKDFQEQISTIETNLSSLNSRLFGAHGELSNKSSPTPVPNGAFGAAFHELDNLQTIVNRFGETAARLYHIA